MTRFVALLRGINVGGRAKVPMTELRALAEEMGAKEVATYVASGNLVFSAPGTTADWEAQLEQRIGERFGFPVTVVVRSAADWPDYINGNPFPEALEAEPHRVMMFLAKTALAPDAGEMLQQRARDGEVVRRAGDALWIYFPGGAGNSRLSMAAVERQTPVTARNWRTVRKIGEMLGI